MILFINTTTYNHIHFAIINNGTVLDYNKTLAFNESHKTLGYLEQFLKKYMVKLNQFNKIIVVSGPGSFTGIRVGIAIAQAISYAHNLPIIYLPATKIPRDLVRLTTLKVTKNIEINYGAKPNITKSKK